MNSMVWGKCPSLGLMDWLRTFWQWRDIGTKGIWLYQQNAVSGQRRALRLATLHGPVDWVWLYGGAWDRPLSRPPPPPPSRLPVKGMALQ